MVKRNVGAALAAVTMAFGASAANAETFATLGAIPAEALSPAQMKSVEGKQHIYFLVESRGVELPAQAEAATRAAAPTPQSGMFRRSPSRDAAAFDFLGTPALPTRI